MHISIWDVHKIRYDLHSDVPPIALTIEGKEFIYIARAHLRIILFFALRSSQASYATDHESRRTKE